MTQFGVLPRATGSKFFPVTRPIVKATIPPKPGKLKWLRDAIADQPKPKPEIVDQVSVALRSEDPDKADNARRTQAAKRTAMEKVASEVEERHGISLAAIRSRTRNKDIVAARHELAWKLFHELHATYSEIGRFLWRDHSTIIPAVENYEVRHRSAITRQERFVLERSILDEVCAAYGISIFDLRDVENGRKYARARETAARRLRDEAGCTRRRISALINRHIKTLDSVLRRAEAEAADV